MADEERQVPAKKRVPLYWWALGGAILGFLFVHAGPGANSTDVIVMKVIGAVVWALIGTGIGALVRLATR